MAESPEFEQYSTESTKTSNSSRDPALNEQVTEKTKSPKSSLETALNELEWVSYVLRALSITIFCLTLLNITLLIAPLLAKILDTVPWLITMITGFQLLLLAIFDTMRREGNTLFEEISDELQWQVRGEHKDVRAPAAKERRERPNLQVRIVLRTFVQSTDMILVPGKYGAIIYGLLNLLLLIFYLVLHR